MGLTELNKILEKNVADLSARQPLKGLEKAITGIEPAAADSGPRYRLAGYANKTFLRMNSNSYLGLHLHPDVIAAEEACAKQCGSGPGAVRFISGTFQEHLDLEKNLADFHTRDAGMIFSAAYAAIVGVLQPLITKETIVISDQLNHNSIINAIRMARPLAKAIYNHNDPQDLETKLISFINNGKRILVITDGIFSMRGDHAPLAEIHKICAKYQNQFEEGVVLVVDDSHGVGAFGQTGRGTEEYCGIHADILIATLGKAMGVNGGYVVSSQQVINYLRETAPLYIYSNPITPAEAAAASKSLEIIKNASGKKLLANVRKLSEKFRTGLIQLGLETISGEHPVVPLLVRNTAKTAHLVDYLFEKEISKGKIEQLSNQMSEDRMWEEYPDAHFHKRLFDAYGLLRSAFNGVFQKPTGVQFTVNITSHDKEAFAVFDRSPHA
ncbi:MAG: aminotransferase class I/II-fold pyridoxal phosphate-dependent enzyme, partial [Desulfamplus sp.]|nr:aminotransferase class I/II-fold pyridoxal phosphate-dependent enzyme [Desulfamplus sp.]